MTRLLQIVDGFIGLYMEICKQNYRDSLTFDEFYGCKLITTGEN